MNSFNSKVIGIVGGMGPLAGNELMNRITRNTPAASDQDHLPVILASFPADIADRTRFLEGKEKENPGFAIGRVIQRLESAGASVIGLACNTSHVPSIFNTVKETLRMRNSNVQLLSMPVETCRYIQNNLPAVKRVGLMTTNGTYRSGMYQHLLQSAGYEVVNAEPVFQNHVIHRMIYDPEWGIKATPSGISAQVKSLQQEALDFFASNNTDAIILGCTEFSLLFGGDNVRGMQLVDTTECLAKALVYTCVSGVPPVREQQACAVAIEEAIRSEPMPVS
jgi:aspartate racemase